MTDVEQSEVMPDTGPVPLSFPAILRNVKLSDRFAHLHIASQDTSVQSHRHRVKQDRQEPEGKRWVRRRENAKFTHNPHITLPTSGDFAHPLQQVPSSTFPHPLPTYLPRALIIPPARTPRTLASTSSAGLFSLSLRGARRTLRARPSSPYLVRAVESHLAAWLEGGTYLYPDQVKDQLHFPGDPVGGRDDIREVCREAARLVWAVKADPALHGTPGYGDGGFERYLIHCVARWYGVVSFSKDTDGYRLTYLLRPNVVRPDPHVSNASRSLGTPPTTDASDFHVSDAGISDFNTTDASDVDSIAGDLPATAHSLSDIDESRPSSPALWSIVGGSDFAIDSDNNADDPGFAASMESLSLSTHTKFGDDVAAPSHLMDVTRAGSSVDDEIQRQVERPTLSRTRPDRERLRTLRRSPSSPSPARRSPHRLVAARGARRKRNVKNDKKGFAGAVGTNKGTFYDYLFM
ncbi:hypothetical protein JVU11DRAFT_2632 [Chiua virens]|nr:hypothetical protein JVU11DRAFT_2632 [Chiua virens]